MEDFFNINNYLCNCSRKKEFKNNNNQKSAKKIV